MAELPLFPLNTVLFPGAPIQLHVFEPRYLEMVRDCLAGDREFGVVLIRRGAEALGPLAKPHGVGCRARIEQVERLTGGRLNLRARGGERFHIEQLRRDRSYLVGEVRALPMDDEQGREAIVRAAARLRPWVRSYGELLASVDDRAPAFDRLPARPLDLAWTAAWLLQVPSRHKQDLLACPSLLRLLGALRQLYREELPLAELLLGAESPPMAGPFSLN